MTTSDICHQSMLRHHFDDDLDDDPDDEDDEDDEDDLDDEDDEDEDVETWQVSVGTVPLKIRECLTSGAELPRLTPIYQLI